MSLPAAAPTRYGNQWLATPSLQEREEVPMSAGASAYLVIRRDDGFGEVYPLIVGQRCTLGRAATNRIVVKDGTISARHHRRRTAEEWRDANC